MTGYGRGSAEDTDHPIRVDVEMTSLNRKTLDVQVACLREWNGLDMQCKEWLKGKFQRGRIHIQIKVESTESASSGLAWSAQTMDECLKRLRHFAEARDLPFQVDSHLLLDLAKMLRDSAETPDWRVLDNTIRVAFDAALTELNTMRAKEGAALREDLLHRLQTLETLRQNIAAHVENAAVEYQQLLMERLRSMQLDLDLNDERVLKEVALFADRCDVSEELTRLKSHFEQFEDCIQADEAIGRKMDFLCQEIHREFNTIGSKVSAIESIRTVIEGKNELERIREQVQNIE